MTARPVTQGFLPAAATAIVFTFAVAVLDTLVFRWLDVAALATLRRLPPDIGPVWLSLPRFLVFVALGMLFVKICRAPLLPAAALCVVFIVGYFFLIRFGGGIWYADDLYARMMVYLPLASAPIGFSVGVLALRRVFGAHGERSGSRAVRD